jgi:cyclohexanecarboxylate-CoA ligase
VVDGDDSRAFERLTEASGANGGQRLIERRPGADDVIQIMFTSGTTGEPKGVMHTSNTLYSTTRPLAERMRLDATDIALMASPMAHQTGFLIGMVLPIHLGGTAVLQDIWNAGQASELIAAERVTFTMGATPFLADLTAVAEEGRGDFASLRLFMSGGAPIPRQLVRRASEHLGAAIVSIWGMTENGACTTTRLDDPPEKSFETDGCPNRGVEIRTVDAAGNLLPADREGRLQSRACSTFVGYLKRPQWYAVDPDGWFETGDLARIDVDGYVRITGRTKDVLIRGGENIPVVEIEEVMYQHPAVAEVAIVAMPDPRLGERGCAFVVARPGQSLTLPELVAFLTERRCAKNYMPERLELVDSLPRTPSGKIQKFRLREMAQAFGTPG